MTEKNGRSKQLFNETVNYEQTVRALIAFAALVVHDGRERRPDGEFGLGRRMTRAIDSLEVTPDLVAQKSTSYGIAAEAKRTLGREQNHWIKCVLQASKYRVPLQGWFTPDAGVAKHDAVVLVHQTRARQLARYLEQQVRDGKLEDPGVSLVEFNESVEATVYYFFRLERGGIADVELHQVLDTGRDVPINDVLQSFANVRYYDSRPPMPLLLSYLWTDYFPSFLSFAEFDEKTKTRRIRVNVQSVTQELQVANGSAALKRDARSVEFPKFSWVQDAFVRLRKFGLAKPVDGQSGDYDVYYKAFKGDVRQRFCDLEGRANEPEPSATEVQPDLFEPMQNSQSMKAPS